jgi:NADH-quinone oxidoreductase subunit A
MNNYFNISFLLITDYLEILILLLISIVLSIFLVLISYYLVIQIPDSEKLSTYECGYEPYETTRNFFNINFCLVAIFFVIFDIEILFVLPWCVSVSKIALLEFWSMIDFLFELGVGFFYIWYSNSLNW